MYLSILIHNNGRLYGSLYKADEITFKDKKLSLSFDTLL